MKYFKRLKIYKASNVSFDPLTKNSYSYDWWQLTRVVNGKVLFNRYHYSMSTCKHISKVSRLVKDALCIDVNMNIREKNDSELIFSLVDIYKDQVKTLEIALTAPRKRATTKERIKETILDLKATMRELQALHVETNFKVELEETIA